MLADLAQWAGSTSAATSTGEIGSSPPASPQLSAALGEAPQAESRTTQVPAAFRFAKVGPSGCRVATDLDRLWRRTRKRLPAETELVAVAYADHVAANAVPIEVVLDQAARAGLKRILIDSFDKTGGSVIDRLGPKRLQEFGESAREKGFWWALAGSLTFAQTVALLSRESGCETDGFARVRPDCVAVRGAACRDGRKSSLCHERLDRLSAVRQRTAIQLTLPREGCDEACDDATTVHP
jgi:uncharacterized protein (UPF0264 family)